MSATPILCDPTSKVYHGAYTPRNPGELDRLNACALKVYTKKGMVLFTYLDGSSSKTDHGQYLANLPQGLQQLHACVQKVKRKQGTIVFTYVPFTNPASRRGHELLRAARAPTLSARDTNIPELAPPRRAVLVKPASSRSVYEELNGPATLETELPSYPKTESGPYIPGKAVLARVAPADPMHREENKRRVSFAPDVISPPQRAKPARPIPNILLRPEPREQDPLHDILRWLNKGDCLVFHGKNGVMHEVYSLSRTSAEQALLYDQLPARRVIFIDCTKENVEPTQELWFRLHQDQGRDIICKNHRVLQRIATRDQLSRVYGFALVNGKLEVSKEIPKSLILCSE